MSSPSFQFPVLVPQDCEGCGLCCEGIGSPVAIYTYRLSHSGGYLYRPPTLPEELGREIDAYFAGLKDGEEPLGHCLWFDPQSRRCKHHDWRPNVCRQYEVGCTACLDERRPYLTAAADTVAAEAGEVPQPDVAKPGSVVWPVSMVLCYLGPLFLMYTWALRDGLGTMIVPPGSYFAWLGYVFAFAPLLMVWCVLGPGSGFLRCGLAILPLVALLNVIPDFAVNGIVLFQAITFSVPLAVMRSLGIWLGRPRPQGPRRRRAQFTLAHLVLWTVGAALLLAVASFFHRAAPQLTTQNFLLAVTLSLGPWAALWAAMSQPLRLGRWLAVALLPCLAAFLAHLVLPQSPVLLPALSLPILLIETGIVASILLSARWAGVSWVD